MKIYTNDSVNIAAAVRNHLNTWQKRPSDVELESIKKDPPSMMLQQLSGTEKIKAYINGSYIGAWRFAVYVRVAGEDTAERLDATACLSELAEWLTEQDRNGNFINLPTIDDNRKVTKIELASTPSMAAKYEDGTEDYQAIFTLNYKYIRRI